MRGGRRAPWRSSVCLSAQRRPSRTVSRKPFADRHQTLAQLCKSRRYPQLRKSPIRLQNGQGVLGYYLDLTTRNYPSTWSNYQRLMTKTVLSSMRSFSLTCCRYSSWLTACSRIALQVSGFRELLFSYRHAMAKTRVRKLGLSEVPGTRRRLGRGSRRVPFTSLS